MSTITLEQFGNDYLKSIPKGTPEQEMDAMMAKVNELAQKGITVEWFDQMMQAYSEWVKWVTQAQNQDAFAEQYKINVAEWERKSNELMAWVWLWAAWLAGGIYWLKQLPPDATKVHDIRSFINTYFTKASSNIAPEFFDEKADNFVRLIKNMSKEEVKEMAKKWFRWVYDKVKSLLKPIVDKRKELLNAAKGEVIWYEALDPIMKEIEAAKAVGNTTKAASLERVMKWVKWVLDDNGWFVSLETAEDIKEEFYSQHQWRDKSKVAWVSAAEVERDLWVKKIAQGFKQSIETKVPWIMEYNAIYGRLKEMEQAVAPTVNKAAKSAKGTAVRAAVNKFWDILSAVPYGGSTVSRAFHPIEKIGVSESKLPDMLEKIRKWGDKIVTKADPLFDRIVKEGPGIVKQWLKNAAKNIVSMEGMAEGAALNLAADKWWFKAEPLANVAAKQIQKQAQALTTPEMKAAEEAKRKKDAMSQWVWSMAPWIQWPQLGWLKWFSIPAWKDEKKKSHRDLIKQSITDNNPGVWYPNSYKWFKVE